MTEAKERGGRGRWTRLRAALLVLIAVGLAGLGWLSYERYLSPDAWKRGWREAARGLDESGHPWIGAKEPELTIHEYLDYECPHCPYAHKQLRLALAPYADRVRLVRHDYARMPCTPNSAKNRRERCLLARAGACLAREGRFWEWSDAVIETPRPLEGGARGRYVEDMARRLAVPFAALDECMYSDEIIDRAQAIYREARKMRVSDTPTYVVDGERLDYQGLMRLFDRRL